MHLPKRTGMPLINGMLFKMNFLALLTYLKSKKGVLSLVIYFLIFLPFVKISIAQTSKADSLKSELQKNIHDTTRIKLLNALAWEKMNQNPDTSILLSEQALKFAQKLILQKEKRNQLRRTGQKAIAKSCRNLGVFNDLKGNYSKALDFYKRAIDIFSAIHNKKGVSGTLGNIGLVYQKQGNYTKALYYHFKSLEIDRKLVNKKGIAASLSNIGIVFCEKGDYLKALDHYFKALEIEKEIGNKSGIATNLGNIGIVYLYQSDYQKSIAHFIKSLEIVEQIRNIREIATNLSRIGVVYSGQNDYPMALDYYLKALEKDIEIGNKIGISRDLGNIGTVYYYIGNYEKALDYFFKAMDMDKKIGNNSGIARHLANIGSLYTEQKQYARAEKYLINSLNLAEEISSWERLKFVYQHISALYTQSPPNATLEGRKRGTKNALYSLAFEHYEKYLQAKDTLFNEEKSENMGKLEARHEFALMEIEREQVERKQQLAKVAAIKKRNTTQYSVIFMVMVGIILIAVLFLFTKFKTPWLTGRVESHKLKTGSVFITLLLLFEFILLMADAEIEKITGSDPVFKLGINAILATFFYFFQHYTEKILSFKKLSTSKTSQQVSSIFIFFLVVPFLCAFAPLRDTSFFSRKDAKSQNTNNHGGIQQSTYQPINLSTYSKTDSLKTLLSTYQNQYNELRSTNKQKEAYEIIQKYGVTKDSLQKWEQSQEFAKVKEKQDIEIQKIKEQERAQVTATLLATQTERKNNLKYSGILIFIILLFVFISTAKKFHISLKVVEGGLFVSFLLFFEFIIVFADPYIEGFTGGAPAWKLLLNLAVALVIFPLHQILEKKVKGRVVGH